MYTGRSLHSGRHMIEREGYCSEGKRPRHFNGPAKKWKQEDLCKAIVHYLLGKSDKFFLVEELADVFQTSKDAVSQAIHTIRLGGRIRISKSNQPPRDIYRYSPGIHPGYRSGPSSGWIATLYNFAITGKP